MASVRSKAAPARAALAEREGQAPAKGPREQGLPGRAPLSGGPSCPRRRAQAVKSQPGLATRREPGAWASPRCICRPAFQAPWGCGALGSPGPWGWTWRARRMPTQGSLVLGSHPLPLAQSPAPRQAQQRTAA